MAKKLDSIELTLKLPFITLRGVWKPSDEERRAAWEIYVELITRISVVELDENEGILREALNSLHSLFSTTREILRKYGPIVASIHEEGSISLGRLAVAILNYQIRPVLAKWHPILQDYEIKKSPEDSIRTHEGKWEHKKELRNVLNQTRLVLIEYSELLAKAARVDPLIDRKEKEGNGNIKA